MAENKAQVTGHMTISKSGDLDLEQKKQVLAAPEGKERIFQKTLIDPETNKEVVIKGRARLSQSKKQSLTAWVSFKLEDIQSFIVDKKAPKEAGEKKTTDLGELNAKLGLVQPAELETEETAEVEPTDLGLK
jgi:hypothetical protein